MRPRESSRSTVTDFRLDEKPITVANAGFIGAASRFSTRPAHLNNVGGQLVDLDLRKISDHVWGQVIRRIMNFVDDLLFHRIGTDESAGCGELGNRQFA